MLRIARVKSTCVLLPTLVLLVLRVLLVLLVLLVLVLVLLCVGLVRVWDHRMMVRVWTWHATA